ncbi:MAG: hypothetical protein KC619_08020 [Myxococcales bacterium]|nr:hypothetical protein [Myxococcales bacterium]
MTPPEPPRPTRRPLLAAVVVFVLACVETAWIRFRMAPAFGAMFDDFGGRAALPAFTRAWVYGVSPYAAVLGLATLLLVGAAVAGRTRPRGHVPVLLVGATLLVATLATAFFAFYLPLFATS